MQPTNRPPRYSGMAFFSSSNPLCVWSAQAMPTSATMNNGKKSDRRYQPRPSKQKMNESRYSVSGASQSNGIEEMFCVMWLVIERSITVPIEASASHKTCKPAVGAISPCSSDEEATAGSAFAEESMQVAHNTA